MLHVIASLLGGEDWLIVFEMRKVTKNKWKQVGSKDISLKTVLTIFIYLAGIIRVLVYKTLKLKLIFTWK